MRNHTDVMSKNSTASFRLKEGESAIMVVDSRMEGSSIERHRKRIFDGRSKSLRARRNTLAQQSTEQRSTQLPKPQQSSSTVMQKMEQMQEQINRLTELLQQKEKRETEEQRKINDIISIKNREVKGYVERIEQLSGDLETKNRELQACRLQIQRLQRCNRIQHETQQLSDLIEQENGRSLGSFFDQNSRNEYRSRPMSQTVSPENSAGKKFLAESDRRHIEVGIADFLSPFSVTKMVDHPGEYPTNRQPSPLKDAHNLLSLTVPARGFHQYQQVMARPVPPAPFRGNSSDPSY